MSRYLITGASSGIGYTTAIYLLDKGNEVVLVARQEEKLKEIKSKYGNSVEIFVYDLNNLEQIQNIFDFCLSTGDKLDGLIYCAGVNKDMPIRANDIDAMREVVTVNAFAFIEMGKFFSKKKYSKDGSSIVAISSMASMSNAPGMCVYSGSKAMLNSTIVTMSKEFARRKIRVNGITPGDVDTPMLARACEYASNMESRSEGAIAPIYVSYMIEYLISEQAKHINGAIMPIIG